MRPEFEDRLAQTLHEAWHEPVTAVAPVARRQPPRRLLVALSGAAAVAMIAVVGFLVTRDDTSGRIITGDSTVTTTPPTAEPTTPTSEAPVTTTQTTAPSTTEVPVTAPPVIATAATPEEQTVLDYLTALSAQRYDDAATLLGQGGLEWTGRADLRPLFDDAGQLPDLAAALQDWCDRPALCVPPTRLATSGFRVVATFTVSGIERSFTFTGGTFEGSPLVHGLPPQLPPTGVSLDATVACPTEGVEQTLLADLDGDGWIERLTIATPSDTPAADATTQLIVCGTTLDLAPLDVSDVPDFLSVDSADVEGDGLDELFLGSGYNDLRTLTVYRAESGRLAATGQEVTTSILPPGQGGTSFGCADRNGDDVRDLERYTYQYEGGTDLSNSTALTYTVAVLRADGTVDPIPLPLQRLELPAQTEEAFRVIAGYCGALPVQTG